MLSGKGEKGVVVITRSTMTEDRVSVWMQGRLFAKVSVK